MADSNVPSIRFKGFTDPWEQRKLGELYENRDERGNDDLQILSVSIYGGVSDGSLTSVELGKNVKRSEDKSLYKRVESGDAVLNMMRAWQGAIGTASVEGMVSPAYIVAKPLSSQNQRFFDVLLRRLDVVNQMNDLSYGVTDFRKRLYWDSFVRVTVDCPSLAEQQAIGRFFSRLDSLITLHQRKYDKLVVLKKSMLEQMFPREGESAPRIRFSGFTDPWEQRKLGELEKKSVIRMGRGNVISAKDMADVPGSFPVYSSSALDNGQMGSYGKYMFDQELVTWSIDGGGAVFYRKKHKFSVTNVSGYIATDPDKMSCAFLAQSMSLAHSRINFDYTVKAHPSVIRSLYTLGIPSLAEQRAIGRFFSRLDSLITLHQRKLELLQNIKKSLLEQMFV